MFSIKRELQFKPNELIGQVIRVTAFEDITTQEIVGFVAKASMYEITVLVRESRADGTYMVDAMTIHVKDIIHEVNNGHSDGSISKGYMLEIIDTDIRESHSPAPDVNTDSVGPMENENAIEPIKIM